MPFEQIERSSNRTEFAQNARFVRYSVCLHLKPILSGAIEAPDPGPVFTGSLFGSIRFGSRVDYGPAP
jgi:hypothetical protein